MEDELAIKIENVSKTFKLPHEKNNSIKGAVINFYKRNKSYEEQRALQNISFEIKKGEFFGIVGRNGSGKSTLLKLLAGIYAANQGSVTVKGKLTPFIELGVGFNQELSGRENVFLNGALLGFNRKEMEAMYKDIVAFAELERFMDQKLKNYSSGMQVRLAFSIAIRVKSDILLLDEVLAVGDAAFQRKCLDYFGNLKAAKQTVVFVSHDMASMQKYCDRVAWIDKSKVKAVGPPQKITQDYIETFIQQLQPQTEGSSNKDMPLGVSTAVDLDNSKVKIEKVWLEDVKGKSLAGLTEKDDTYSVKFRIRALKDVGGIIPGVIVTNDLREFVTASNSAWGNYTGSKDIKKGKLYEVEFKMLNVYEKGDYKVSVNVVSEDFSTFYAWKNEACQLESIKKFTTGGKVNPKFEVKVSEV
jgi:ABC-2 type transport system ATP-binding protein